MAPEKKRSTQDIDKLHETEQDVASSKRYSTKRGRGKFHYYLTKEGKGISYRCNVQGR
jgi:predicted ArsR family transcriptional regulator